MIFLPMEEAQKEIDAFRRELQYQLANEQMDFAEQRARAQEYFYSELFSLDQNHAEDVAKIHERHYIDLKREGLLEIVEAGKCL